MKTILFLTALAVPGLIWAGGTILDPDGHAGDLLSAPFSQAPLSQVPALFQEPSKPATLDIAGCFKNWCQQEPTCQGTCMYNQCLCFRACCATFPGTDQTAENGGCCQDCAAEEIRCEARCG